MISQTYHVTGLLCIHLFVSSIKVSQSFPDFTKLEKNETQINHCRNWQFQCKTGQCIVEPSVCDGSKDCIDYSDESYDQCRNKTSTKCKEQPFQCHYGACIEKKYLCDGRKHCIDGSDETPDTCNDVLRKRPAKKRNRRHKEKSCALPPSSADKKISYRCSKDSTSGTCGPINGYVPELTIATVTCSPGYYRDNSGPNHACVNSEWLPMMAKCVKKCGHLNHVNVILECTRNGVRIGHCDGKSELLAGTKVRPTCKPSYKYDSPPSYYEITCDNDGKWDNNLLPCVPECGKPYTKAQLTIAGGTPESIGGSPWHVAIYDKNKVLICGGTIISETLVLSAAHCFSDGESTASVDDLEVVIGKYTSNYAVKDNSYQRTLKIKDIRFPRKGFYALSTFYASDIAILILKEKIPISPAILPACLNWDALKKKKYPTEDEPGKVVGWGRTENDTLSTVLRNITLPFISYQRCVDMVNDDFKSYVTYDKFCAGTRNHTGPTLMDGDSGGGLLFEEKNLFYLRGIVSVKQKSSNAITVFSDLSYHIDWIASIRDQVEEKVQTNRIQSAIDKNLPTVSQTHDIDDDEKPSPEDTIGDIQPNNFPSTERNHRNLSTVSQTHDIDDYEKLLPEHKIGDIPFNNSFSTERNHRNLSTVFQTHDDVDSDEKPLPEDIAGDIQPNNFFSTERNHRNLSTVSQTHHVGNAERPLPNAIIRDILSNKFSSAEQKLQQSTDDTYSYVVKKIYDQQTANFELLLRFTESIEDEEQKFRLYYILLHEIGNSSQQIALYKALWRQETFVKQISYAFENDGPWTIAGQLSANIHDTCYDCLVDIYNKVVETVWSKVTLPELLREVKHNLINISERMVAYAAILDKLKQTDTSTAGVVAALAHSMKDEMDRPNYNEIPQNNRTNYEVFYNSVKVVLREAVVGPISAAFLCGSKLPAAERLSADVYVNCHKCIADIYEEVVETIWNEVPFQEILSKAFDNLGNLEEKMAVHTAIVKKLNQTGKLNAGSAAALADDMMFVMNRPYYKKILQDEQTNYEELYSAMKMTIRDAAVGPISAAFQNNTSWPTAKQLSADVYNNCKKCLTDLYNEVVETVWNKVTIQDLLEKTASNLKYIQENMILHAAMIEKLKQTGTLTASSAAALANFMTAEMDMPNYKNVPQDVRTNYEALYNTMKMTIREAAVGPISAALQNDTSWLIAAQVSADIYFNCHECIADIYNEVVETVWNKITIQDLLDKTRNNSESIYGNMVVHEVIIKKLKQTGTLTTRLAAKIAQYMKEEMDMPNYKEVLQNSRTNYEALYSAVKMTIREASVGPISAAFQNNTSWPTARQLSSDIYVNCIKCIMDIYKDVLEIVWNKVTVPELLQKAKRNLAKIGEDMAIHTAIFIKLKQTGTLTASLAAMLAQSMKYEMGIPNYKKVLLDVRTDYEVLYNKVKMTIREAALGPITAAFQNDTSWPTAMQLSADIYKQCHECITDIYNEVVGTVWNKVTIRDMLHKTRGNLEYVQERMAVHNAIIKKLKQKGTLTPGLAATLAYSMEKEMDMSDYKAVLQDDRTNYEILYTAIKLTVQEGAVGPISAAFQNDTSWPTATQLSADVFDNCSECIFDIYEEVVEAVWNKVIIRDLLQKTRNNLEYIQERMAVHNAIINKLKQTGTLTAGLAVALAYAMKNEMDMPNYEAVLQDDRTNYEALYSAMQITVREGAVGPISSAFRNDTSWPTAIQLSGDVFENCSECPSQNDILWPTAIQLSADVFDNCSECIFDIYKEVVETVWNKVTVKDLLSKARDKLIGFEEEMAIHMALLNKLLQTNVSNVTMAVLLKRQVKEVMRYMKEIMDLPNYKEVSQKLRSEYETRYEVVKTLHSL